MPRASSKEVRKARSFLNSRGIRPKVINPKLFANSAKELDIRFSELLALIRRMTASGQNQQFFRQIDISNAAKGEVIK